LQNSGNTLLEVFPAKQTPSNNDEGGEGYTKDHPEDSTQCGAPEKDRDHNHDWMKPRFADPMIRGVR